MKRLFFCIVAFLLLASCESKSPISIEQSISKEMVTLEDNYRDRSKNKDSVRISIPTEFEISINSYSAIAVSWDYIVDGKSLYYGISDYQAYNKEHKTEPIHQISLWMYPNIDKISIIVKERKHLISNKDAQELIRKYNVNSSLDHLQFGDTIKLTTFDKFRRENKAIIETLKKINDSIIFRVVNDDLSLVYVRKKIDW
jgi:hypothetical protein